MKLSVNVEIICLTKCFFFYKWKKKTKVIKILKDLKKKKERETERDRVVVFQASYCSLLSKNYTFWKPIYISSFSQLYFKDTLMICYWNINLIILYIFIFYYFFKKYINK